MTLDTARNISLIWLSLLCFIALAPPLVLLYFAVRGMDWVTTKARPLLSKAHQGSDMVQERAESYSNQAAKPLIRLKGEAQRWQKTISALLPK